MTVVINGTTGITAPALDSDGNLEYSGTLTGGTGVVNLGSGQVYKDASGNVGIGTSSPASGVKLDVNGKTKSTTLDIGTTAGQTLDLFKIGSDNYIWCANAAPILFGTNNAERARIDSSGNLLVGVTSGVGGVPPDAGYVLETNGNIKYRTDGANSFAQFFNSSGSQVGGISTNGTATTYATSSDYRLKENVAPMTGALATVAALKPCTYTWKSDGSAGQGFIAHELQAVVPDCVSGEKDAVNADGSIKPQGIDVSFLVATLTAAIQELKAEFDAYKAAHP